MPIDFPPRASLARTPTPIEPLARFGPELGGPALWIQRDDLTGSALSGNKIRKLEFHLPAVHEAGADTLLTCGGIQSNHCRATAVVAARNGLHCHLVLRGQAPEVPRGNLFLDLFCGAEVTWVTPEEYRAIDPVFERIARELVASGRTPYILPEGASDALGSFGYLEAAGEIARETDAPTFTHLVHACGSGGTAAGLALGRAEHELPAEILSVAVCDDRAYFEARIGGILDAFRSRFGSPPAPVEMPTVLEEYVGAGYGLSSEQQRQTMIHLARTEGIVLDPTYSGKAFHALVEEAKRGRFAPDDRILFIHTGGIFGLLAQAETFAPHLR